MKTGMQKIFDYLVAFVFFFSFLPPTVTSIIPRMSLYNAKRSFLADINRPAIPIEKRRQTSPPLGTTKEGQGEESARQRRKLPSSFSQFVDPEMTEEETEEETEGEEEGELYTVINTLSGFV